MTDGQTLWQCPFCDLTAPADEMLDDAIAAHLADAHRPTDDEIERGGLVDAEPEPELDPKAPINDRFDAHVPWTDKPLKHDQFEPIDDAHRIGQQFLYCLNATPDKIYAGTVPHAEVQRRRRRNKMARRSRRINRRAA